MKPIPAPSWSLKSLYESPKDPAIQKDFRLLDGKIARFEKTYANGRIGRIIGKTKDFLAMLECYEEILSGLQKPITYAHLRFAEQSSLAANGAFYQGIYQEYTKRSQRLIFVETDLQSLPRPKLKKLITQSALAKYKNYLKGVLEQQAHHLPEREEQIFADTALTGSSAFRRMFTEEHSRARYTLRHGKKEEKLAEEELLHRLHSPKREERKAVAAALSTGLEESAQRYAFLYNTLLADKQMQDKYRRYHLAEESRHLANETNTKAVDALVTAVRGSYGLVEEYYGLRGKLLGIRKLEDHDRYAPLHSKTVNIPFARAKELIVDSFNEFSPLLGEIALELFEEKRVDAFARTGKRGGAFCDMGFPPSNKPFVFMNYRGSWRDVFTLAHEFGHAVHGYLSLHHQTLLSCNPPLTTCETASTFAEALLFNTLESELRTSEEKQALYVQRIDDSLSTVYRQIAMFLFERDCHALYRKKGELSVEEISEAWYGRQKELFRGSVKLNPGYRFWWAYIPHVFQWPFYVYSYAFGDLLSLSLFEQYQQGQKNFSEKYIQFLSAGSSASPAELMKPFGAKLDQAAFWKQGVAIIRKQVAELERSM